MAILLIKIESEASLLLNEFYDYAASCYALSRSRTVQDEVCIDLDDMYDATVEDEKVSGIPVVFLSESDGKLTILGWYRKADIYRKILRPTLFLEGNVRAQASDAVLLRQEDRAVCSKCLEGDTWPVSSRFYDVVEEYDHRYYGLRKMLEGWKGEQAMILASSVRIHPDAKARRSYDTCIQFCETYASDLMNDRITDIRDIVKLQCYAEAAVRIGARKVDGYYYLAMADYQLGMTKDGLRAINKALALEPDASDLMAQKAFLLSALGQQVPAAELLQTAYQSSGDEAYLLEEGKVWLLAGQMDKGYQCFQQIQDQEFLKQAGIELHDLEKKWPFVKLRNFNLMSLFKKKNK